MIEWVLPDGTHLTARIREVYRGLHGQTRICLVDATGRVHHYDYDEVGPA